MINDCTLLLSTYDGGEDLWEGFFTALTTQWKDFNLPVVVNTETKTCAFKNLNIKTINSGAGKRNSVWGRRLINTLKQIDTEYVLFFLEDFWLDAPVDVEHFEKCRQWMRDNKDVACLSFQRVKDAENMQDGRFERFEKRSQNGKYRMNCQSALWRRENLISNIMAHENAWEWEKYGTIRSRRDKDSIYSLIDGMPKVFSYDLGGVVYKGRWCKRAALPLIEEYNIKVDTSIRGFHEDWLETNSKRQRKLLRGIKNRINIIRSLVYIKK